MISNIFAGLAGVFFAFAFAPEWFDGALLLAWLLSCAATGIIIHLTCRDLEAWWLDRNRDGRIIIRIPDRCDGRP